MSAIRAAVFDLDGTLVQTEVLKAQSYARAAAELRPGAVREQDVLDVYHDYVGRSRNEVASALMVRFDLRDTAARRMTELGASTPEEAFVALRLRQYEAMIADAKLLRAHEFPEAVALLRRVHGMGLPTAIATMSHRAQAVVIVDQLGLATLVDVLVTVDDVAHPKPAPDIYLAAASALHTDPGACFALEDSVPGIRSALAAGMLVVAVTNELTREAVHRSRLLPSERIVDDHERLESVVMPLIEGRLASRP